MGFKVNIHSAFFPEGEHMCVQKHLVTSVLINFNCPGLFFVIWAQRQGPVIFILKNSQALNKYIIYQELRDFGESYLSETEIVLRTALKNIVLNRK